MYKRKKVGLALGGGGARGLAHLGVLKVLKENNIPIDYISGTSMGALIGAIYATNPSIEDLNRTISLKPWNKIFDYNLIPKAGFLRGDKAKNRLREIIGEIDFDELKIPLYVTAFDLKERREVIFNRGSVLKAVRASISIPGVFIPIENEGRILVDGGVVDPIPSEILSFVGADIVIAVNVNDRNVKQPVLEEAIERERKNVKIPNIVQIVSESIKIMEASYSNHDSKSGGIDVAINIKLEDVDVLDFSKWDKIIEAGEMATKDNLESIKKLIKRRGILGFARKIKDEARLSEINMALKKASKDIEEAISYKDYPAKNP